MMSHRLNLYKVGYLKILLKPFGKISIIVPEEVRKQSQMYSKWNSFLYCSNPGI